MLPSRLADYVAHALVNKLLLLAVSHRQNVVSGV